MRKTTLLASAAALSLFGATTIAAAQSMNQPGPRGEPPAATAPKADKAENTTPAAPPAAKKPAQTQTNAPAAPAVNPSAAAPDQKAMPQQAQDKPASAPQPKSATTPAVDNKAVTTGVAPSGTAAAAPPAEKRSQITTAIKQENIPAVTNVNFNISVGARVPSTVRFYPVPTRIIEIYPEWRGYQVILVNGRYIIVRPQTYEIVYIIEG